MRHISQLQALSLLLLAALSSVEARQEQIVSVTYLQRSIKVEIPSGYCHVERQSELGKIWYAQQQKLNEQNNEVAIIFCDCKELQLKASDPRYRAKKFGIVMLMKLDGALRDLPGTSRAAFLREVKEELKGEAGPDDNDLERTINKGIERLGGGTTKRTENVDFDYLDDDENGVYAGMGQTLVYPKETVRANGVTAITLLNRLPVGVHMYDDYKGRPAFRTLLAKSKMFAGRLVNLNP